MTVLLSGWNFPERSPPPNSCTGAAPCSGTSTAAAWTGSFYGQNIDAAELPVKSGNSWEYTVQLEPNERHWLFALDYPVAPAPGIPA